MHRDPIVELVRRTTWAGWVDVLILFVAALVISAATGNAHVGTWTTYDIGGVPVIHR